MNNKCYQLQLQQPTVHYYYDDGCNYYY